MTGKVGRHADAGLKDRLAGHLRAGLTVNAAAAAEGCSNATAARVAAALKKDGMLPAGPPLRLVALQDEVNSLRAQLRAAQRAAIDAEAVRSLIGVIAKAPTAPPPWVVPRGRKKSPALEVPVTIWSDWHAGEVVSRAETNGLNEFDTQIFERRVRRLVETTIDLCFNHGPGGYPGIVVNLLGDFVSGGLHPELAKSDEEEVIPTTLRVRDMLVWAIDRIAEAFGQVYLPCVAGNHGRNTPKPEFKRYVFKSFDWLIYQMLARHYAGRADVVFNIPDSNEVLYRVHGRRYLAMHGDMLGVRGGDGIIGSIGPIMRGEVKVGKQSSAIGRDYDMLLMGHWHQELWLPRAVVANSLKGFDEYAKNALRAVPSTPSQPLWLVHPKWGETMHRNVFLEDPGAVDSVAWVSWSKAA